jgi:hypothetical protein
MWIKVSKGDQSFAVAFMAGLDEIYVYNSNYTD